MSTVQPGDTRVRLSGGSIAFCWDMLPRISRTFALSIPLLPEPLDGIAAMAYLLTRIADTFEDAADVPVSVRVGLLRELGELTALPPDWPELSAALADRARCQLGRGLPSDQARLVGGLPTLLDDLAGRPYQVRRLVRTCLQEKTEGLAQIVLRQDSAGNRWPVLADLEDVLSYCDIAAGTVGRMLTSLFAWRSRRIAAVLPALEPRTAAFARVLRLTGIITDVAADLDAGRCWLPRNLLAEHGIGAPEQLRDPAVAARTRGVLEYMIAAAHRELTEAIAYIEALPAADVGVRQFCVANLLLVTLTLRKLQAASHLVSPAPVEISRRAVKAALLATRASAARPAVLAFVLAALRQPLFQPLPPHRHG